MNLKLWAAISIFLLGPFAAKAHNIYFLPGDAFFSIELSREVMKKWTANESDNFVVDYRRFSGGFMPCGNLGYYKLRLKGISPALKKSLEQAFQYFERDPIFILREDIENGDKLVQLNSVVALIYNADFDGPVGLKLNENWPKEGLEIYDGYATQKNAIVLDWKLGPKHRPLDLLTKIDPGKHFRNRGVTYRLVDEPIDSDASKLKIVLVGHAKSNGYSPFPSCPQIDAIHNSESEYIKYLIVTSKGFTVREKIKGHPGFKGGFKEKFHPVDEPKK